MLTIDGINYDVKVSISRSSEMKRSEISGLMLDNSYFLDILGQYLVYEIDLLYPLYNQGKYADLYEVLTAPVDAHEFVLPYNESTVTITASVETVRDELLEFDNGRHFWRAASFAVESIAPTKEQTLGQVIARGRTPLPDIASVQIGDTYTYTANGWQKVTS